MRRLPRMAMSAAISTLIVLGVSLAPAQADDSSPTPAVDPVETDGSLAEEEVPSTPGVTAPTESGDSPSTPVDPQDSQLSPDPTTASKTGPTRAAAMAAVFSTQIFTPADGADVPAGSVEYSVQVATAGDYWLDLYCDQSFITDELLSAFDDGERFTGSIGPVDAGASCRLELYGISGTGEDVAFFTVERPIVVPEVRNPSARPNTFYPRVRDGFRDVTQIGFGSRLDSDVTVKIVAGSGAVVRTFTRNGRGWADYYERRSQPWNGRNRAGNLVPTGRYTAVITSTLDGRSDTARLPIWVASGHRTVRVTKTKDGWWDSIDQTRGNCYAWEVSDGNDLDCWGGRYAQATYRFSLPSNAHNIDWGVRGYQECCDRGRITRTGVRTSASSFRIAVRVTYWRSFVVRSTWVSYTYRKAV